MSARDIEKLEKELADLEGVIQVEFKCVYVCVCVSGGGERERAGQRGRIQVKLKCVRACVYTCVCLCVYTHTHAYAYAGARVSRVESEREHVPVHST